MPGPWVAGSDNPGFLPGMSWKLKEVYEVYTYGDTGERQGKLLVEVVDTEAATKSGKWLDVRVVAIEDAYLVWWFSDGDGRDLDFLIRLHICAGPFSECRKVVAAHRDEFHADVVRKIDEEDVRLNCEAWWTRSGSRARYGEWRKGFLEDRIDPGRKRKKRELSEDHLDFAPTEVEEDEGEKDGKAEASEADARGLKKKLKDLKEQVRKGDKNKGREKKKEKAREVKPKKGEKKKREISDCDDSSRGRDRRKSSERKAIWFGRERKSEKGKRSLSCEHDRGRDRKRKKDDRKKKKSSSTSTSERKKRRKKKKERREDRGPYGSGRRVKYGKESDDSGSDSDDSSVFQGGVPDKKAHQLILQEYAEKRPGRLTARMLQKMSTLMSRSGTPANQMNPVQDRTPPVATPYLLTVILPMYKEKLNLRLLRELKTLSYALDFMALGQGERASDILAQRIKALELVLSDQGWNRAQFLELIPPEGAGLADPEEQRMASKEQALDAKLKSFLPGGWKKNDGGKGDGKEGKAGKKGKGLGKIEKQDWRKERKEEQKAPSQ